MVSINGFRKLTRLFGFVLVLAGFAVIFFSLNASSASLQEKTFLLAKGGSFDFNGLSFTLADLSQDKQGAAFRVSNGSTILGSFEIIRKGAPTNLHDVIFLFNNYYENSTGAYANLSVLSAVAIVEGGGKVASEADAKKIFSTLYPQYPAESLKLIEYYGYWIVSGNREYSTPAGSAAIEGINASIPTYSFLDGAIIFINKATGEVERSWKTN